MTTKQKFWMGYVVAVIAVLFVIEQSWSVDYVYKVMVKATLILLPLLWIGTNYFARPNIQRLKLALLLGIGAILFIQIAYALLQQFVDTDQIKSLLAERQRITADNFVWIAIYVTFGNSLLEELLFRSYIPQSGIKRPWLVSSLLFAIYHLAIFIGWFSWWVLLFALFCLVVGGLIFCWLNANRPSLWNSWLMHIFADISILVIGFNLFF